MKNDFNSPQKLIGQFKMESLLHRNIANIIKIKLHHVAELQKITISKVRLTPDHHNADVYYTTWDFKKSFKTNRLLVKNRFLIQKIINKNLRLRRSPTINFKFDDHLVRAEHIDKIINDF